MCGESCRRLLAALSLILAVPLSLPGQSGLGQIGLGQVGTGQAGPAAHPPLAVRGLPPSRVDASSGAALPPSEELPQLPPFRPAFPPPIPIPPRFPYPNPPGIVSLPQLVRAAGIIFSGQILAITRASSSSPSSQPALGTVAITFRVEHAIRGAAVGKNLTIHEWAGLWSGREGSGREGSDRAGSSGEWSGRERYRVGQRLLVFLYPSSKLGLTSPVAGILGRFNIDASGEIVLSPQNLEAFRADPQLGGRTRIAYATFAQAVRRAGGEE